MTEDLKNHATDLVAGHIEKMEENMKMWFRMKHGLYLNISSTMISLSVAAIGFAAVYLLENEYHSGKYKTIWDYSSLVCLLIGGLLLIVSCVCGFVHLLKNLEFFKRIEGYFITRFTKAITMLYQKNTDTQTDEEENTEKFEPPKPHWWHGQVFSFSSGMILLIAWVVIDFSTPDPKGDYDGGIIGVGFTGWQTYYLDSRLRRNDQKPLAPYPIAGVDNSHNPNKVYKTISTARKS